MRFLWLLSFFCVSLTAGAESSNPFKLDRIESGLICSEPDEDISGLMRPKRVCVQTDKVTITGQGQCNLNGEWHACTWYGYHLFYEQLQNDIVLDCLVQSDKPSRFGNPNEAPGKSTKASPYQLMLAEGTNSFFNPQYTIVTPDLDTEKVTKTKQSCSLNDTIIFEYELILSMPASG